MFNYSCNYEKKQIIIINSKMLNLNFQDEIIRTSFVPRPVIKLPEIAFTHNFSGSSSLAPPSNIVFLGKNISKPPLTDRVCMTKPHTSSGTSSIVPSFQITDNLKLFYVKRVEQLTEEFKKILSVYHSLEKDANKSKQSMFNWFSDLQGTFFLYLSSQQNFSVRPLIPKEIKENVERPNSPNKRRNGSLQSCHSLTASMEIENLKVELQGYKKNSIQAVEKVSEIFEMVKEVNVKYQAEITQNRAISEAVTVYTENTEAILQKINQKQQKEKKITLLERQIHQILTKLKFKAFTYTIRQQ